MNSEPQDIFFVERKEDNSIFYVFPEQHPLVVEFDIEAYPNENKTCPFDKFNEWAQQQEEHWEDIENDIEGELKGRILTAVLIALDMKFVRLVKEKVYSQIHVGQRVRFPNTDKEGVFLGIGVSRMNDFVFPDDEQTKPSTPYMDDPPDIVCVFKYIDEEETTPFVWREESELKQTLRKSFG